MLFLARLFHWNKKKTPELVNRAPAAKPEHSTGPADHPLFPAAEIGIDIQRKLTDDHDVHVFHVLILLFPCFQHVILA